MRDREPVVEVRRREREGEPAGRRVSVEGKCPVWKVVRCRRRWPDRDLGSVSVMSAGPKGCKMHRGGRKGKRTVWVKL